MCSASEYLDAYAKENGFDYRVMPVLRSINILQDFKTIVGICRYIKEKEIGIVVKQKETHILSWSHKGMPIDLHS